ncbi:CotH kinase family protein [Gordonia westfalica]|uniref:CotH kinase family protein n=1 Tax=Gordonia westfalica TaxID=158898 RepID=A0ABU2GUS6_9ACTN|nr:CotH kinase family protein [Gordonia westfalica]MDS1115218.1 CotH kinase family protein [Gordonia westfalica]
MPDPTRVAPPKRRWRHRIPKSLRQHWKLPLAFVLFVVIVASVFGATTVRPYITGDADIIASEITDNITGTVDLFDTSVTHELSVEMTQAEYNDMITSFQKSGDKKWVTADVTIDGTRINDASVRLKGNSTLMGVRGIDPAKSAKEGAEIPEGIEPTQGPPGMGGLTQASADDPTSLPLLISFDENADGRAYQGMTELSVRPGSPVLNEAMALSLTAATDQPTQRYAYTVYSVNGSPTATRLVLEHPDDTYANSLFDSDGYLYKADANSRLEYRGDDQSAYADQFKQINAVDSGNLQPLITFLKWLDSANDKEFDAHLADYIDVESFAKYLATQNLLVNGDDMSGPGQNYYLWYDLETRKFTVVSWDLNLAMTGDATIGPKESASIGPGGQNGPPEGADGAAPAAGVPGKGPGGGKSQKVGNQLKERFLESGAFADLYDETYWSLYEQIYRSGAALRVLDELATTIPTSDGLTAQSLETSVEEMRAWVQQRTTTLDDIRSA